MPAARPDLPRGPADATPTKAEGAIPSLLGLGVLGRPHGVRGEIVFHPHNPSGVRFESLRRPFSVWLGPDPRTNPRAIGTDAAKAGPYTVVAARGFQDGALVGFEKITDRDAVAVFTNREILVPRDLLPPLAAGEFYLADLIGCRALDPTGGVRGEVVGAFFNGQHDVVVVKTPGGEELLYPAVPEFLTAVDLAQREVVIDDHE